MKVANKISVKELLAMAEKMYGNIVKAVVDLHKQSLVVDAEMHADIEAFLLENGSSQQDLWGINLYPEKFGTDNFVEFDSMINIRPRQKNMSRYVEDPTIIKQILDLVARKITK